MSTTQGTAVFLDQIMIQWGIVCCTRANEERRDKYNAIEDPEMVNQDNKHLLFQRDLILEGDIGPRSQLAHVGLASVERSNTELPPVLPPSRLTRPHKDTTSLSFPGGTSMRGSRR